MAANSADILRDKLYSEADAQLRRRIDERLEPLRLAGQGISLEIVQPGTYTLGQLANMMADAYMEARRDQNRNQYVDDFIRKVVQYASTQRGQ